MEDKKNFIINVLFYGLVIGLAYLCYEYVFSITMPFIIGLLIAYFSIKLCNKLFLNDNKLHRSICLLSIYVIIVFLAILLTNLGINKSVDFFISIPKLYSTYVEPALSSVETFFTNLNKTLSPEVERTLTTALEGLSDSLKSLVSSASTLMVKVLTSIVTGAPNAIIYIIVIIISSFYICFDYEKIAAYVKSVLPERAVSFINEVKAYCENNLFNIIKSYIILMAITLVELFIGFAIFKVNNAGLYALLISVVDILPILGVGTILIPWGIICLLLGNTVLGLEILGLYIVITLIRNLIEPIMVGGTLGLHPLASLISMIVGLDLIGVVGMLGFPLMLSFFVNRKKQSYD